MAAQPVETTNQFRGLDAVSRDVAWVGGTEGGIFRTVDGGDTWVDVSPPDTSELQFRDVEAFGRNRAVVLAIGSLEASRIYRTDDGGQTWTQTFINTDPDPLVFYDCMAFSDARHGLALSDPRPKGSSASSRRMTVAAPGTCARMRACPMRSPGSLPSRPAAPA